MHLSPTTLIFSLLPSPPPFTHSLWFHLHNFPRAFQTTLFNFFATRWKNINLLISSVMWWCVQGVSVRRSGTEIRIPGSTVNIPKPNSASCSEMGTAAWGDVQYTCSSSIQLPPRVTYRQVMRIIRDWHIRSQRKITWLHYTWPIKYIMTLVYSH